MKRFAERLLNHAFSYRATTFADRIVYFHSVMNDTLRSHTLAQFESYLECLVELGYKGVSVKELIERGSPTGGRRVGITFDDGYSDNLQFAAPLLLKYGFTATIYMVTEMIEEGTRKLSNDGHRLYPDRRMLNTADLRELDALGFEIGSHTCTHALMSHVCNRDPDAAMTELASSKRRLEDILGKTVAALAYPNGQKGAFNRQTVGLVKEAGYTSGATTLWGTYQATDSPLVLNRCEVSTRDDVRAFAQKINGQQDYRFVLQRIVDGSRHWR